MNLNKEELYGYLIVGLGTLLLAIFPILTYVRPNFVDPFNFEPNIEEPEPTTAEPITFDLGFLNIIFYLLGGILAVLILYFIVRGLGFVSTNLRQDTPKRKTAKEIRRELEDARLRAYEIINQGIETGDYRPAFIEAYIALDTALENFRDIQRPKYVTPKEYAFTVDPPVFQPSVYRFVSTYYNLRYGSQDAILEDLLSFKEELDYLFIEDVPIEIKQKWGNIFDRAISSDYQFKVPRIVDPKRPGGK